MIAHSIKVYHDAPDQRPRVRAGSQDHRYHIRLATVRKAKLMYCEDTYVCVKGDQKEVGVVIDIHEDDESVIWNGLQCRPIEVHWYATGGNFMYHPDELEYWEGK